MEIKYISEPLPERSHVVHAGLLTEADEGLRIHETPCRKAHLESLQTDEERLKYLVKCHRYHHGSAAERAAQRAEWDAEEEVERLAQWHAEPLQQTENGQVLVRVRHQDRTYDVLVPADAEDKPQAIKDAWQAADDERQAKEAALEAFTL